MSQSSSSTASASATDNSIIINNSNNNSEDTSKTKKRGRDSANKAFFDIAASLDRKVKIAEKHNTHSFAAQASIAAKNHEAIRAKLFNQIELIENNIELLEARADYDESKPSKRLLRNREELQYCLDKRTNLTKQQATATPINQAISSNQWLTATPPIITVQSSFQEDIMQEVVDI